MTAAPVRPEDPVTVLPGVGPARAARLQAAGLDTVGALLRLLPRRHEDRTRLWPLQAIRAPGTYGAAASVRSVRRWRGRSGVALLQAQLADGTGTLRATWFNQDHLGHSVIPGARLLLHGLVVADAAGQLTFQGAEVVPLRAGQEPAPEGWLPVYPHVPGLPPRTLRMVVQEAARRCAPEAGDAIPPEVRARWAVLPAAESRRQLHLPTGAAEVEAARRSLVFGELLLLQVGLQRLRRQRQCARRAPAGGPGALSARFLAGLPFALTAAQRRVLAEIEADRAAGRPAARLVQGDVGSGKTVVAAAAMLRAVEGGAQAALLCPTEVLAQQHAASLRRLYGELCRVELLTASTPRAERRDLLARLAAGEIPVLVGTHALLQPDVRFAALGLAVTDEQHRFGVRQRATLAAKGQDPDVLVLTATPIPRTLAMTLYGDLDVSLLDELPPGRRPVHTYLRTPERRGAVYDFVRGLLRAGRQAFVVCPLIAGADDQPAEAAAAAEWAAQLAVRMPEARIGLLHGRLPAAAKEEVLRSLGAGDIQLLVATTVVEVGLDLPNAAAIVIEEADRFGLSQLHQLRGRVGRGPHQAYCILIAAGASPRLEILTRTHDGFAIAEEDLRQRGPGQLLGTRQHGLPELELADLGSDAELLLQARTAALELLAGDPALQRAEHAELRAALAARFAPSRNAIS